MTKAIWVNGKRQIRGYWHYNWSADRFIITLDSVDKITGELRCFYVYGDKPEWGNWKLLKKEN